VRKLRCKTCSRVRSAAAAAECRQDACARESALRGALRDADDELASLLKEKCQVAAARKLQEKWRGRSRRAKQLAQDLRETLPLTSYWSSEFEKLLKGKAPPEQQHLRALWECQLRCLRSKSHRCRWHPEVMSWCADVWRRDRGAYEQMAFGNVLLLPHPDTVRKHCASSVEQPGHDPARYAAVGQEIKDWSVAERESSC
jgi:hypothetical protein